MDEQLKKSIMQSVEVIGKIKELFYKENLEDKQICMISLALCEAILNFPKDICREAFLKDLKLVVKNHDK